MRPGLTFPVVVAFIVTLSLASVRGAPVVPIAAIVAITQAVLQGTMDFGFDRAGEHLLGSRWPTFKTVLGPLLSMFPGLLLDNVDMRRDAAQDALTALRSDDRLREALETHIAKTSAATTDLWIRVDALETALADHDRRLNAIEVALRTAKPIVLPVIEPAPRESSFKQLMYSFATSAGTRSFIEFKGQLKASCVATFTSCREYESLAMLPGARTCVIREYPDRPPVARCELFDAHISYLFEKADQTWTAADLMAKGKLKSMTVFSPLKEEARLAYIEMIRKVDAYLPPHWERSFPRHWYELEDPGRWKSYDERLMSDFLAKRQSEERSQRANQPRTWSSLDMELARSDVESSRFIASEPGNGRVVMVLYERGTMIGGSSDKVLINVAVEFR